MDYKKEFLDTLERAESHIGKDTIDLMGAEYAARTAIETMVFAAMWAGKIDDVLERLIAKNLIYELLDRVHEIVDKK